MGKNVTIRFVDLDKEVYINSNDLYKWLTYAADDLSSVIEANMVRAIRNEIEDGVPKCP